MPQEAAQAQPQEAAKRRPRKQLKRRLRKVTSYLDRVVAGVVA